MDIPERIDSKFRYVLLAAQRAEQMMRGARPQVESHETKATTVALQEISEEAVAWDYGPPVYSDSDGFEDEFEPLAEAEPIVEA